jgi:hypothetical protein
MASHQGDVALYFKRSFPVYSGILRPLATRRYVVMTVGGYWPVIQKLPGGRLGVVTRDADFHSGQQGRLVFVDSRDGGESWSRSTVISADGPDNRNSTFGVAADGTLLVTFIKADMYVDGRWDREKGRGGRTGIHVARSADGGASWSRAEPLVGQGNERWRGAAAQGPDAPQVYCSPYGKMVRLPDGTMLMGYGILQYGGSRAKAAIVLRSRDTGRTWVDPVTIAEGFTEPALFHLGDGRMIAMLRRQAGSLHQCDSADSGYTWSEPHAVTASYEYPGDVIRLQDGRLLLTFGHREPPHGVQGMLSRDEGRTWDGDRRLFLVGDATYDCGYPKSVQRDDGTIVTVYYSENLPSGPEDWTGWQTRKRRIAVHAAALHYRPEDLP